MSEQVPKFTETGEWISPRLEVGGYEFTYDTTQIKFFGDEWNYMNHVEYTLDGKTEGVMVNKELIDTLMSHNYPFSFRPFPTQRDLDWFVSIKTQHLEDEIVELYGTQA